MVLLTHAENNLAANTWKLTSVPSLSAGHLSVWDVSVNLKLTNFVSLVSPTGLRSISSSAFQVLGLQACTANHSFLERLGIWTLIPCFCSRCFTAWTVSSAPSSYFRKQGAAFDRHRSVLSCLPSSPLQMLTSEEGAIDIAQFFNSTSAIFI